MLSYQHGYHAGNLADLQKHAALAWMLAYLTQKDKPLSYIETHAGRGLYDLASPEALRTGEAAQGITALLDRFAPTHPYRATIETVRKAHGPKAYPGSPLIAASLLRPQDRLHLAELHPQEHAALRRSLRGPNIRIHHQDGFELAQSLCPPEPRRGLLLIDPSWEIKEDYQRLPRFVSTVAKAWNVGIIALWYPILADHRHAPMLDTLDADHPEALRHELRFPPIRKGHGMVGTGLFVVNPPWGLDQEMNRLASLFPRPRQG